MRKSRPFLMPHITVLGGVTLLAWPQKPDGGMFLYARRLMVQPAPERVHGGNLFPPAL